MTPYFARLLGYQSYSECCFSSCVEMHKQMACFFRFWVSRAPLVHTGHTSREQRNWAGKDDGSGRQLCLLPSWEQETAQRKAPGLMYQLKEHCREIRLHSALKSGPEWLLCHWFFKGLYVLRIVCNTEENQFSTSLWYSHNS